MIRITAILSLLLLTVSTASAQLPANFGGGIQGFQTNQLGAIGGNTGATGGNRIGTGSSGGLNSNGLNSANSLLNTTNRNSTTTSRNSTQTTGTNSFGSNTNSPFGTGTNQTGMNNQGSLLGDNSQSLLQPQQGGRNGGLGGAGNNQFGNLFQNQFRAQTAFGANPLFNSNNNQRRTGTGGQPALRLGFEIPVRPVASVETGIDTRLQAAASQLSRNPDIKPGLDGINVEVRDAGVVRLTGSVNSEEARRRAANMIRLEPGVKKVLNELVVAQATKEQAPKE